jgi:micrococcal nuclease
LYRRHPLAAVALLAVVLILSYSRIRPDARPVPGSDYETYHNKILKCIHVADGDTIDVDWPDGQKDKTRIRLWGVDTPETDKSPGGEQYFGPEASAFTKSFALGKPVRLELVRDDTRGKYGRLLAYVYVGDVMLNEALLENGFAYADRRFAHWRRSRFVQLEDRAKKRGVGLWQGVTIDKMPEWRQRYEAWREAERD